MKLDPRIKQGCRPFTMFDTDAAKEFIGKQGFFHDDLDVCHAYYEDGCLFVELES